MSNYVEVVQDRLKELLPDLPQDLLELYTLLAITLAKTCTLEDVHDAWAVWRNKTAPEHRSLIPFDELTPAVQELDRPYMDAIHIAGSVDKHVGTL